MELLCALAGAMIAGAVQQVRIARRDADLRRLARVNELVLAWWRGSTAARRELERELRAARRLVGLGGQDDAILAGLDDLAMRERRK
mgnify:CR=1 FL=1